MENNKKQLASFVVKCQSCGWDKFLVSKTYKEVDSTTIILGECDRCGLRIVVTLTDGELKVNYAKRVKSKE